MKLEEHNRASNQSISNHIDTNRIPMKKSIILKGQIMILSHPRYVYNQITKNIKNILKKLKNLIFLYRFRIDPWCPQSLRAGSRGPPALKNDKNINFFLNSFWIHESIQFFMANSMVISNLIKNPLKNQLKFDQKLLKKCFKIILGLSEVALTLWCPLPARF